MEAVLDEKIIIVLSFLRLRLGNDITVLPLYSFPKENHKVRPDSRNEKDIPENCNAKLPGTNRKWSHPFLQTLTTLTTCLSWRICSLASTRHLLFTLLQPPCFFQKDNPFLVNDLSKWLYWFLWLEHLSSILSHNWLISFRSQTICHFKSPYDEKVFLVAKICGQISSRLIGIQRYLKLNKHNK